ncbi:MAG: ferritin-like domain-containing protein [Polyangiales bacterium]
MTPVRTVDTDKRTAPFFSTEHERLLGYLRRAREAPEAPPAEALVEQYAPAVRETAVATWKLRMVNEHRSSSVFAGLLPQLIECSSGLDAQTVVLRMAMDEVHHAALCGRVVAAFGAEPVANAEPALTPLPRHDEVSPLERAMRNAMFVGCLAETVAVALVSEERELSSEPMVRWTLDQILGDEVSHARFGWTFVEQALTALEPAARDRTGEYLKVAFGYLERRELELLPPAPDLSTELRAQRESLGLCDGALARDLFFETLRTVVIPRLESLGLPAARAWRERAAA